VGLGPRPELADVARLAGRVLSLAVAVAAARGQDAPVQRALAAHLGPRVLHYDADYDRIAAVTGQRRNG
jgi:hypothetical protein